jgi:hypothetical protein
LSIVARVQLAKASDPATFGQVLLNGFRQGCPRNLKNHLMAYRQFRTRCWSIINSGPSFFTSFTLRLTL